MENGHTVGDLAQMQSLPLDQKLMMTKRRIREWYEAYDGQVYTACSYGKDSRVLEYVVHSLYPEVPSVFVNTGLEFEGIQRLARKNNATIIRPKMLFSDVISMKGYPLVSKEVAEAIEQSRKIRSYSVNVERERARTVIRKRQEMMGERLKIIKPIPQERSNRNEDYVCSDNTDEPG